MESALDLDLFFSMFGGLLFRTFIEKLFTKVKMGLT